MDRIYHNAAKPVPGDSLLLTTKTPGQEFLLLTWLVPDINMYLFELDFQNLILSIDFVHALDQQIYFYSWKGYCLIKIKNICA